MCDPFAPLRGDAGTFFGVRPPRNLLPRKGRMFPAEELPACPRGESDITDAGPCGLPSIIDAGRRPDPATRATRPFATAAGPCAAREPASRGLALGDASCTRRCLEGGAGTRRCATRCGTWCMSLWRAVSATACECQHSRLRAVASGSQLWGPGFEACLMRSEIALHVEVMWT